MASFCLALLICLLQLPEQLLSASGVRAAESSRQVTSDQPTPSQQVQQGVSFYQAGNFRAAIAPWQAALARYQAIGDASSSVVVLENLARTTQQLGQNTDAVRYWGQAIVFHQQLQNRQKLGLALTEQAQAYSRLGQHRRALALLCSATQSPTAAEPLDPKACPSGSALRIAVDQGDSFGQAAALGSLGETYRLLGEYEPAIMTLEQAQSLVRSLDNPVFGPTFEMALLTSLGNLRVAQAHEDYRRAAATQRLGNDNAAIEIRRRAQASDAMALEAFIQGKTLAQAGQSIQQQIKLAINIVPLYRRLGQDALAERIWAEARSQLSQLPASQEKAFSAIALATLADPSQAELTVALGRQCPSPAANRPTQQLLQEGVDVARAIQDRRAESFGLGRLGYLEECDGNLNRALKLTEEARWAADQARSAQDSLYLWDWQSGRIQKALGDYASATVAFQQSIKTLTEIRSDILTANPELQFDFRDTVEPIYRGLAALNLAQVKSSEVIPKIENQSSSLETSLDTIDSLKLAELQNYFGSDCVIVPAARSITQLQTAESGTVVVNTLTFPERTAVIYSFPDGDSQMEWIDIPEAELRDRTIAFRRGLERYFGEYDPALGQQFYGWLVKPFETKLEQSRIATLVFVNDGILRSVPMGALQDGDQFLIQRYAVATTPSLQLTDPQPLARENLKVLALGMGEASVVNEQAFGALPFVLQEIEAVRQRLPGKVLLNDAFSQANLTKAFSESRYPIVHIATHAQFGADPQENFLVTGNNQKITIGDLDRLIRDVVPTTEPIELLMLTGCETAIGDDRAALGLAGVAIRAGARSAVASLWSIGDEATLRVMDRFYEGLTDPGLSKAEALRLAQVALIEQGGEGAHPARWAPYVLIGNWL